MEEGMGRVGRGRGVRGLIGLGQSNATAYTLDEVRHGEKEKRKAGLRTKQVFGVVTNEGIIPMVKGRRKCLRGIEVQRVIEAHNILHFLDLNVTFFFLIFCFSLLFFSSLSLCSLRYLI